MAKTNYSFQKRQKELAKKKKKEDKKQAKLEKQKILDEEKEDIVALSVTNLSGCAY